jgi:integrase
MKLTPRGPNRWRLTWELGRDPLTGRRRQRTETVHGTKRDAERRWREVQRQIDHGRATDPGARTVADVLDRCIQDVWPLTLAPTSVRYYRRTAHRYLRPVLGPVRLRDVTAAQIQTAVRLWQEEWHLGPKSIHGIFAVLRAALSEAVRWEWLLDNPCRRVRLPAVSRREPPLWDLATWQRVYAAIADEPWSLVPWLAWRTGARIGELLALQWADIDWATETLTIRRTLIDLGPEGGLQTKDAPKTAAGRRTLRLDATTLQRLREEQTRQKRWRLAAGPRWQDRHLVCCRPQDGDYWRPRTLAAWWKQRQVALGVPVLHLHDLRHWHATLLLQAGVPMPVVQARLGHARISTTVDTYGHVTAADDRWTVDVIAQWDQSGTTPPR